MAMKTRASRSSTSSRRGRGAHRPLKPFSVDHWRKYTSHLVLDNGEYWRTERFQDEFAADLFSGVPEIWLVVPEGNTKTTTLSGMALYYADFIADAPILLAASSRDQCGLLLGQAIGFVERSSAIKPRFRTYEGYRRVDSRVTGSRIQVYAADDRTGDGVLYRLALLDELHRHRSLRLYRTWRGKREKLGGQVAAISTAGEPGGEFEAIREKQRTEAPDVKVRGRHVRAASPAMILHDYSLRSDDNPEDLKVVKQANPFSGITVASLRAKRAGPTMTAAHWRRFVCNLATRGESAAVGEAEWQAALTDEQPEGQCDVGLDLGWKYDATALVPLFKLGEGWLFGRSRILIPPRDGNSLRPERIMAAFEELHAENPIQRVVMDPSAGGEQLAAWLEDDLGVRVVVHSQKNQPMSLAAARFMEALREGRLKHVRDPVFTRHVLNGVAKELPDGAFKFVRPVVSRSSNDEAPAREIDGLVAGAMVLSVAMGDQDQPINIADYRITQV